jgi:hypothetical protein
MIARRAALVSLALLAPLGASALSACRSPRSGGADSAPASSASGSAASANASSAPNAPNASAPAEASSGSASARKPPVGVAKLAPLHVAPIDLGDSWLVLLGPPEAAQLALLVSDEDGKVATVQGFPTAARVLGHVTRDDGVHLLLESAAALDQPAGLRAVVRVTSFSSYWTPADALEPELADVKDEAELARRLPKAGRASTPGKSFAARIPRDADALYPVLAATSVPPLLAAGGAKVSRIWQRTFSQSLGARVDAASFASSPYASPIVDLVRSEAMLASQGDGRVCAPAGAMGSPSLGAIEVDAAGLATAFHLSVFPGPVAKPVTSKSVASAPLGETTRARLDALTGAKTPAKLSAEAAVGGSGGGGSGDTIAFASDDEGTVVLFVEGAFARVEALPTQGVREFRFADVDGDGRTDLILKSKAIGGDASTPTAYRLFLAPRSVGDRSNDRARELAMVGAPSLDAAVDAASAVPNRGIEREAACKLLRSVKSVASFKAALAPGGALITFANSPGDPLDAPTLVAPSKLKNGDFDGFAARCESLYCDTASPFCESTHNGPGSEHYVFTWVGTTLKLQFASDYRGS